MRLTILSGLQWEAQQACAAAGEDDPRGLLHDRGHEPVAPARSSPWPSTRRSSPAHVTNLAATEDLPVSAVFPPGSTAKVITAAAALERGARRR